MFRTLFLLSSFLSLAFAQVDTGTVVGSVTDPSGAVIPGAVIEAVSAQTGLKVGALTGAQGLYASPPLRSGDYEVSAVAEGFGRATKRVRLDVAQRAVVNFELAPGPRTEQVLVTEVTSPLQTETSTLSNLRGEKAIKELPLNGRNFAQLLGLSAGVMPAQSQQSGSPITMKRGVTGYSVNGTRFQDNNLLVDGINNMENHNGLGIMIFPPLDAIEEFRVEASVSDAQYGRGGGGTVNLTYKSGTKNYHGDVFEFARNAAFDAKNFFDSGTAPIPPFKQNQFGGVLGGPVNPRSKNPSTFFLFDFEGQRIRQAQTYVSSVPVAAYRKGDFSAAAQKVYDPLTTVLNANGTYSRTQFPNNVIPDTRLSTVGAKALALYPLPNYGSGLANNYLSNPVRIVTSNSVDGKIDHNFSQNDTAFLRLSYGNSELDEPSYLPAPAVGNGPGVPGKNTQPVYQGVLSETHIFGPNKVNQARFGVTRLNLQAFNPNYGKYVSSDLGISGGNVQGDVLTSGLSIIGINGLRDLGDNGYSPAVLVSENYQVNDNFSYIRGRHSLKIGGEVQRRRYNAYQASSLRGTLSFGTQYTTNPSAPSGTGLGTASILLGKPDSGSSQYLTGTRGFRRTEYALYLQDDFRVSSRLTLNLGLRYENFAGWPWTEVGNRMTQFVPSSQQLVRVGTNGIPSSGVYGDNNNFGPRAGLAFKLAKNTVFRSAYGIYYSAPTLDVTVGLDANAPYFVVTSFTNNQYDFTGARDIGQGFDRPALGNLTGADYQAVDLNIRTPYVQQWNAAVQQALPGALSLTVGYVGTKSTKLQSRTNLNQAVPGTTAIATRRPYPSLQNVYITEGRLNSTYHALQATVERHLAKDLDFQVAYTLSHNIDGAGASDRRNFRLDKGNSDIDVRNRLVASWTYALPLRVNNVLKTVVNGWQANGILSLYDGLPFSVSSASNSLNNGSGTRADRLGNGALPADQRTIQKWFDASAFAIPGPQLYGNGGRNILSGPGTKQLDFSVFKNFVVREERNWRFQLRGEFFNLTNTPQFNNPAASIGSAGVGTISSAGSPSTYQRTSRQVQLALKFLF